MAASTRLHVVGTADAMPAATEETGHGGLTGFAVRLKPMVFKGTTGFAKVVDRAAEWVHGLELGWAGPDGLASRLALTRGTDGDGAPSLAGVPTVNLQAKWDDDAALPIIHTNAWQAIHSLSRASMTTYDGTWALHAQPSAGFASGASTAGIIVTRPSDTGNPVGRALAEESLAGHDIEVGLPLSPWMRLSGSRYWWGAQDFMPEVRGTRVGVKLTPIPFVEIEGGRLQDSERNTGAFVSARLSIPLGLP